MSLPGDYLFRAAIRITTWWRPQEWAATRPLPQTGEQMNLSSATIRDLSLWKSRLGSWQRAAGLGIGVCALALFGVAGPVAAAAPYVQGAYQDPASANTVS